jgi:hypothetical protein
MAERSSPHKLATIRRCATAIALYLQKSLFLLRLCLAFVFEEPYIIIQGLEHRITASIFHMSAIFTFVHQIMGTSASSFLPTDWSHTECVLLSQTRQPQSWSPSCSRCLTRMDKSKIKPSFNIILDDNYLEGPWTRESRQIVDVPIKCSACRPIFLQARKQLTS